MNKASDHSMIMNPRIKFYIRGPFNLPSLFFTFALTHRYGSKMADGLNPARLFHHTEGTGVALCMSLDSVPALL